nr:isochorismate synthase, chloroplastic [Tanacetum cinerariifolium]
MSFVTSKGSAPELVERETDTRVTCAEIRGSSRIDDEVVQDKRQRDDNDLQDERQDQPKKEENGSMEEAIISEIDSILPKHAWELVGLVLSCKPLGYKWIVKKKMKADGTIDKYKARLAIKEFRQQEGLYYFDTYSTRITPIKMILAIAALKNSKVHQMNVKMTFLNGDLEKNTIHEPTWGFHGSWAKEQILLEEIHVTLTQFGKKEDKIAALHKVTFKECVQCLETASGFVATLSELTSDGVKTFMTASKTNCLNETLEDSARRRRQDSCDANAIYEDALRKSDQMHQTFEKSSLVMTHKLDEMIELPKSQHKRTYTEDLECEMVMVKMPRCMSWLCSTDAYDEPIDSLDLLGHSGSLSVDFSNLEMIEDDWKLESKEISFLGRGFKLPVRPKELEKGVLFLVFDLQGIFDERKPESS